MALCCAAFQQSSSVGACFWNRGDGLALIIILQGKSATMCQDGRPSATYSPARKDEDKEAVDLTGSPNLATPSGPHHLVRFSELCEVFHSVLQACPARWYCISLLQLVMELMHRRSCDSINASEACISSAPYCSSEQYKRGKLSYGAI